MADHSGSIAHGKLTIPDATERLQRLESFFREVVWLTLHHHVDEWDRACVPPRELAKALHTVDPLWYENWREKSPPGGTST